MTRSSISGFNPQNTSTSGSDLLALMKSELEPHERLLWHAQPIPKRFAMTALPVVLFAIPWTAFAIYWEMMAISMLWGLGSTEIAEAPAFFKILFPAFGLPFIFIGFWMFFRPLRALKEAQNTLYGFTDHRAIIINRSKATKVESFALHSIDKHIKKRKRKDGTGSLLFSFQRIKDRHGEIHFGENGFKHIDNVDETYHALTRAIDYAELEEEENGLDPTAFDRRERA